MFQATKAVSRAVAATGAKKVRCFLYVLWANATGGVRMLYSPFFYIAPPKWQAAFTTSAVRNAPLRIGINGYGRIGRLVMRAGKFAFIQ